MFSLVANLVELNRHAPMPPIAKATIATPVSFGVFAIRPGLLLIAEVQKSVSIILAARRACNLRISHRAN